MISVYFGSGIGLKNLQIQGRIKWPVEQGWALETAPMVGNSISASVCRICTNLKELLVEGSNWIGFDRNEELEGSL